MVKLNLKADTAELEVLKSYLEENASPTLVEKIENGVKITKDGKILVNKKDLAGFMKYACEEARKLAGQGATGACVKDEIVFGWLIHYFEEESIEGKLYNEDGTPYQPPKKQPQKSVKQTPAPAVQAKPTPPKPAQFTLFDMIAENAKKDEPPVEEPEVEEDIKETSTVEVSDYIVDRETGEILSEKKPIETPTSPVFQRYLKCMETTPGAVIAMRVGDFYEVFGNPAIDIGHKIGLTITSREVGLPERVPMIGFPYHASDIYIKKITEFYNLMVVEDNKSDISSKYYPCTCKNEANFDDYDEDDEELSEEEMREFDGDFVEEIISTDKSEENEDFEEMKAKVKAFDQDALLLITEIIGDELIISEEDI